MRTCKFCGADIGHRNSSAVYCSKKCRFKTHREKNYKLQKKWREANPRYNAEYCKNHEYSHQRNWRKNNPEKSRIQDQRRRTRKASLPNTLTVEQWNRTLEYFDNCCVYCGKKLSKAHQDHFVPISRGGGYTVGNIVPSCRKCNSTKHSKDPLEWMMSSGIGFVKYLKIKTYLTQHTNM